MIDMDMIDMSNICNKFETSSNHPASPTTANLRVPQPRLEHQVQLKALG